VLIPHLQVLRDAIEGSCPRPSHENYPEFSKLFAKAVHDHLTSDPPTELDATFTQAMKRALK
jgi:hypothetical protein